MSDPSLPAPEPTAQPSLASSGAAAVTNGGGEHKPAKAAAQLLADALVAGLDPDGLPRRLGTLVAAATSAQQVLLWLGDHGEPAQLGTSAVLSSSDLDAARERATRVREQGRPLREQLSGGLAVAFPLGLEPLGVMEARFSEEAHTSEAELQIVQTLAARVAGVLGEAALHRDLAEELERTQALLSFSGEAMSQLAVEPALNAALERIADLLGIKRVAVYLNGEDGLHTAAARGLQGAHERIARRLLELALASGRLSSGVIVENAPADKRLKSLREALAESGVEAAFALPLEAANEVIGLLALYPSKDGIPDESERALLEALRNQLAAAVHRASLHEQATLLGSELEHSLRAERQAAAQLRALYEISRAFAQSLSLQATLEAAAKTIAELVGVDVAVLYMPDERQENMEARALHVARGDLEEPMQAILGRSLPLSGDIARVIREGLVVRLAHDAAEADDSLRLLGPFLEGGSTAIVLPVATPKEVLAAVTLISLSPEQPIRDETIEVALAIVGQAALAIDNARLYEQQKAFADAMQRSLLPDYEPEIEGLDVGAVYAPSARVEIGGDVYDFMVLEDGALAVALGDVTGHGVDAAADMAMVKFTFRSLVRRYPEPGAFLAAVNEVVLEEVELGKFVTMIYMKVDPARTELVCASAGHPRPRLLRADGTVESLPVGGLALGIVGGQSYDEIRIPYAPGDAVVLYTDGVIEARRERELYGTPRLDDFLHRHAHLGARELADAVLADCREFAGGPLFDDCAVVVVRAR
ncbi:MAG: SpoIIE family protein phosphatase [Gaiellaceae bacterium]